MFHFIRPGIIEIINLKLIFVSLLFFEHQYLSYYIQYWEINLFSVHYVEVLGSGPL